MNSIILYCVYILEMHSINFLIELPMVWSMSVNQEIIQPRNKLATNYKESIEAELSYLTERLGFVDDENVQHSGVYTDLDTGTSKYFNPAEKVLHEFLSEYLEGNEAYDTRITRKYFDSPNFNRRLCPTYMMDPIFVDNKIRLIENNEQYLSRYELKLVKFQYFTRQIEMVKVVSCPVMWDGFQTRLYFLEINHYVQFTGVLRGYFVFANKFVAWGENVNQSLNLLIYSSPDPSRFTEMDTEGEEATLSDSLDLLAGRKMKIKLHEKEPNKYSGLKDLTAANLKQHHYNEYSHWFGEEAEIMLLTKIYGFIDLLIPDRRPWITKKMLLILDRMGEDYRIDRERMKAVKKIEPEIICQNYISLNDELIKRKVFLRKKLKSNETVYISKIVKLTQFKEPIPYDKRELLKCPVIVGVEKKQLNIYLLPIYYETSAKSPQLFTFFEDLEDPNIVNIYLLSPVPPNVDEVDFKVVENDLIDLTGDY